MLLESHGYDYAFGGGIALAYWSTPRATVDIDVTIAVEPLGVPDLIARLQQGGCEVDVSSAVPAAQRGDFGARKDGVRVDVFLPHLPFMDDALARRQRVPMAGRDVWVFGPEDIVLLKLVFGRTKDIADLERLFANQGKRLDFVYLDRWVGQLFEAHEQRRSLYAGLRGRVTP